MCRRTDDEKPDNESRGLHHKTSLQTFCRTPKVRGALLGGPHNEDYSFSCTVQPSPLGRRHLTSLKCLSEREAPTRKRNDVEATKYYNTWGFRLGSPCSAKLPCVSPFGSLRHAANYEAPRSGNRTPILCRVWGSVQDVGVLNSKP